MKKNIDNLISKHPEIVHFEEDTKVFSKAVKLYLDSFVKKFPQLNDNLNKFRKIISDNDIISEKVIRQLNDIDIWAYTKGQEDFATKQLERILKKYPVLEELENNKKGYILDLRSILDNKIFYNKLQEFIKKVQSFDSPIPQVLDLKSIGQLPLSLVHNQENFSFHDPIVDKQIDTVWTLDVSHNPALSIKDIMAKQMVEDAFESKILSKEKVIVEGTSGNTGAGLAVIAAYYGIKIILVIPSKMSQEKINRLSLLGANVIVTPANLDSDDPKSYYSVRDFIAYEIKGWCPQQYDNLSNSKAHELVTGPQIWEQSKGKLTALIAPAGTGGTISGTAKYLKKQNPKIKIIAVDTVGSILYLLKEGYSIEDVKKYAKGYLLQGFGEDIRPLNLDLNIIDYFIRVSDISGLNMTRVLPVLGHIGGHSSGAAYAALIESLDRKILDKNDKVVVIFPDTGVPYRHDVYSDSWMKKKDML